MEFQVLSANNSMTVEFGIFCGFYVSIKRSCEPMVTISRRRKRPEHWSHTVHAISRELDEILDRVDSQTAALLEKSVRHAVAIAVQRNSAVQAKDSMGYPVGYFEATEGCFANEPFDLPADLPFENRESW